MQHQAQSPAASLSSKSASLVDDDDSSDSQEGEQASVVGVESNDGLNDGLLTYERQRQERVDRNNQRLFELGLGPPVSAGGETDGDRNRAPTKPRRSTSMGRTRIQPARTQKAKYVTTVSSQRLRDDALNMISVTHHEKHLFRFQCRL